MSLFQEQHHDQLLLSHLNIDKMKILSFVNKHYYKLTKDILQPYRTFFASKDSLSIVLHEFFRNSKFEVEINAKTLLEQKSKNIALFIKAVMYGNYDIVMYIYKKYRINMSAMLHFHTKYNLSTPYHNGEFKLSAIVMMICIQQKTEFELLKFIVNIYRKNPSPLFLYFNYCFLSKKYGYCEEYYKICSLLLDNRIFDICIIDKSN